MASNAKIVIKNSKVLIPQRMIKKLIASDATKHQSNSKVIPEDYLNE